MQKALLFIIIIAVIAAGAYYFFFASKGEVKEINFSETGNLVIDTSDNWYLVYEKPGAPALSVVLNFTGKTKCFEGEAQKKCSALTVEEGERVEVKGYESEGMVEVSEIRFGVEEENNMQEVQLFYYNPENDKDEQENIMCSRDGLVPVTVVLPKDNIIENTIRLLLQGNIPEAAQAEGVTTEYPLEGFELDGAVLDEGILTLTFNDPNNKTIGGSCRVGILWFQIEATALQFPEVDEVKFEPEDIFQP